MRMLLAQQTRTIISVQPYKTCWQDDATTASVYTSVLYNHHWCGTALTTIVCVTVITAAGFSNWSSIFVTVVIAGILFFFIVNFRRCCDDYFIYPCRLSFVVFDAANRMTMLDDDAGWWCWILSAAVCRPGVVGTMVLYYKRIAKNKIKYKIKHARQVRGGWGTSYYYITEAHQAMS